MVGFRTVSQSFVDDEMHLAFWWGVCGVTRSRSNGPESNPLLSAFKDHQTDLDGTGGEITEGRADEKLQCRSVHRYNPIKKDMKHRKLLKTDNCNTNNMLF
jgi:hypothetical protein